MGRYSINPVQNIYEESNSDFIDFNAMSTHFGLF